MKEKTPLSHHGHTKLCPFRCLISRCQNSKYEVSKSNSWKISSFYKWELFLTMSYTINPSTLLVTKKSFMTMIFFSNYQ